MSYEGEIAQALKSVAAELAEQAYGDEGINISTLFKNDPETEKRFLSDAAEFLKHAEPEV